MRVFVNGRGVPPPYASTVIQQWNFDESSSSDNLRASIGSGTSLTVSGTPAVVRPGDAAPGGPSIGPGARRFNGSTTYFSGGSAGADAASLTGSGWTVYTSFRLAAGWAARGDVVCYGASGETAGTNNLLHVLISSSKYVTAFWENGAGANVQTDFTEVTLPTCKWIHCAVRRSGADVSLFLNGSLVKTVTTSGAPSTSSAAQTWHVGASEANNSIFNGDIEFVQVHNAALSDATIENDLRTMMGTYGARSVHTKVEIKDSGGTYRELTSLLGVDWVTGVDLKDDNDAGTMGATITCLREIGRGESWDQVGMSLAKWHNNRLNRQALTATGPASQTYTAGDTDLLDLARQIRVWSCRLPFDFVADTNDWQLMFDGYVDSVDWGGDENQVTVTARDLGAKLIDCAIRTERQYGSTGGTAITSVAASILSDAVSLWGLASAPTLYTAASDGMGEYSSSPSFSLYQFDQYKMPVKQALDALFEQIGFKCRYRWNYNQMAFVLTAYEPERLKRYCDLTLSETDYETLTRMGINIAEIRTVVSIVYQSTETSTPAVPTIASGTTTKAVGSISWKQAPDRRANTPGLAVYTVKSTDLDTTEAAYGAIGKYGEIFMEVTESAAYNIDHIAEAQRMGVAILRDLAYPKASTGMKSLPLIEMELHDFLRIRANNVHATSDLDMAVSSWNLSLKADEAFTEVAMRGYPSGGTTWALEKEARPGVGRPAATQRDFVNHGVSSTERLRTSYNMVMHSPFLAGNRQSLLPNLHLQDRTIGAYKPPDGWSVDGSGVWLTDMDCDTTTFRRGAHSLKQIRNGSYDVSVVSRYFPVAQNQYFTWEGYARASAGSTYAKLQIEFYDSSFASLSSSTSSKIVSTSAWDHVQLRAASSSSSVRWARVFMIQPSSNPAGNLFWADMDLRSPPPQVRAYLNTTNQSIVATTKNTWVRIQYNATDYDYGGGMDTSSTKGRYTVQEAGWYEVEALAELTLPAADGYAALRVTVNGTVVATGPAVKDSSGSAVACNPSVTMGRVLCSAGDYIDIEFNSIDYDASGGTAEVVAGQYKTWVSIRKCLTE